LKYAPIKLSSLSHSSSQHYPVFSHTWMVQSKEFLAALLRGASLLETIKDRKYWIRLNSTIEHFNLSIDTWSAGSAAYSKS